MRASNSVLWDSYLLAHVWAVAQVLAQSCQGGMKIKTCLRFPQWNCKHDRKSIWGNGSPSEWLGCWNVQRLVWCAPLCSRCPVMMDGNVRECFLLSLYCLISYLVAKTSGCRHEFSVSYCVHLYMTIYVRCFTIYWRTFTLLWDNVNVKPLTQYPDMQWWIWEHFSNFFEPMVNIFLIPLEGENDLMAEQNGKLEKCSSELQCPVVSTKRSWTNVDVLEAAPTASSVAARCQSQTVCWGCQRDFVEVLDQLYAVTLMNSTIWLMTT